ncbi:MAG TPA: DUF4157 domain-containing protein [Variovorax sp.]|nr:DUF4157 domain-containing protein [Variovorax sp.]
MQVFKIPAAKPKAGLSTTPSCVYRELQAKLEISEPGDVCEQEADRIASQAVRADGGAAPLAIRPYSSRTDGASEQVPASVMQTLASAGRPLEPEVRRDMEHRFGYDFARVRVHSDALATVSAREVHAHAYTVGRDVVFNEGRYSPGTREGRQLIAHELTHVVQQNATAALQRNKVPEGVIHEKSMQFLEDSLRQFYEALPRKVRIELKADGVIAIAMVSQRNTGQDPRLVYAVAGIPNGPDIRKAAEKLNLVYVGDTEQGISEKRPQGPARQYGPNDGPPPGSGGLEHAEQLIKAYRQERGVDIDGLVVSRPLCHDCVRVMPREKGGRIMISVIVDPDKTLPNPRDEAIKTKEAAKAKEVGKTAGLPENPDATAAEGRGRTRSTSDRSRGRAPTIDRGLGGRGGKTEKTGSLRGGKVSEVANRRGGGGGTQEPPAVRSTGPFEGRGEVVEPIRVPEPAIAQQDIKGGVEGAAAMINAGLFSALQGHEVRLAVDRLKELTPEIESWRERGYGVGVTMVVEVPDQPDVLAGPTGVHSTGDIVHFKKMYISSIAKPVDDVPEGQQVMTADYARGDPKPSPSDPSNKARKGFHLTSGFVAFPAPPRARTAAKQTPVDVRGLPGSYKSEYQKLFTGDPMILGLFAARTLRIGLANDGKLTAQMRLGSQEFNYQAQEPRGKQLLFGRFNFGGKDGPVFTSTLTYEPDKNPNVLLEWFGALEPDAQPDQYWKKMWDGLISWRKI